ncbi:hypothetical protein DFR50_14252 [Roseiarcus fermentans]|uniref:Uncharacterized protein n=1 Tax=Roseiarcus fermentans TaxID=1473586 RepID=A0A366ENF3_9HYPH|nr:hypothetical protein DFR50_14252 [Roseiarcus fermentans]
MRFRSDESVEAIENAGLETHPNKRPRLFRARLSCYHVITN